MRGKSMSEEAKSKIRVALIGHPIYRSKERSSNISKALTGRKIGKFTEEHRRNMSIARAGSRNYNWRGGISKINKLLRRSLEYRIWREKVFCKDNYTCQFCGKRGGYLEADHIKPFSQYESLRYEVDNGRTLCRPCHLLTDTWGHKKIYVRTI